MAGSATNDPFGPTDVPAEYSVTILAAATKWGIPPALLAAQLNQESSFNPGARSPDGAIGIAQFLPSTAKALGIDPTDPHEAIAGMAELMSTYYKRYGSWEKALIAYHGGPGAVDDPGPNSREYVAKILGKVKDLVTGPFDAATDALNPVPEVSKLFDRFTDRDAWIRVGKYLAAIALLTLGAWLLIRSRGAGGTTTVRKVVKSGVQNGSSK